MKIKPLFDYVLIEPLEQEMVTKSGIVLPETVKERPQRGRVIEVGTDVSLKAGDVVYYKKWGGHEVKLDGKDMLLIAEDDVLAIIKERK